MPTIDRGPLDRSTYGEADEGEFEKGMALANGSLDTSVCAPDGTSSGGDGGVEAKLRWKSGPIYFCRHRSSMRFFWSTDSVTI